MEGSAPNRAKKSIEMIATGFGLGKAPFAPGTFGTLLGIPLALLFQRFGDYAYLGLTLGFVLISILIAQAYEKFFGTHDAKEVVIDEVAGYLVAFAWLPSEWIWYALAFVVFRIFDAAKPFPINIVDKKVKGGVGVVADDLLAGVITNVILQAIYQKGLLPL